MGTGEECVYADFEKVPRVKASLLLLLQLLKQGNTGPRGGRPARKEFWATQRECSHSQLLGEGSWGRLMCNVPPVLRLCKFGHQ